MIYSTIICSAVIGPRCPLKMDPDLDYEVYSDDEWEEVLADILASFPPSFGKKFIFCFLHRRILVRVFLTVRRIMMNLWKKIPKLQMKRMKIALLCLMAISQTMRYILNK